MKSFIRFAVAIPVAIFAVIGLGFLLNSHFPLSMWSSDLNALVIKPLLQNQKVITKNLTLDYGGVTQASLAQAITDANVYFTANPTSSVLYVIKIPTGTFDLSDTPNKANLKAIIDFSRINPNASSTFMIKGSGPANTKLILPYDVTGFYGSKFGRVTVRDLHLTTPNYSVTQGVIIATSTNSVTIRVPAGFPTPAEIYRDRNPGRRYLREYTNRPNWPTILTHGTSTEFNPYDQVFWTSVALVPGTTDEWKFTLNPGAASTSKLYKIGNLMGVKSKFMENMYNFIGAYDFTFDNILWTNRSRGVFRGASGSRNISILNSKILRSAPINGITPALSSPGGGPQIGQPGEPVENVTIKNFTAVGTGDDSIGLFEASNVTIENAKIYDSFARGILFYKTTNIKLGNNNIVRAPIFYEDKIDENTDL